MRAMLLKQPREPLSLADLPTPHPLPHQVLIRVSACGLCRTDLHIYDGELLPPKLPLILGHQVVGEIVACGKDVRQLECGMRVGVPWLGHVCGECQYCRHGAENLCDVAQFTGYHMNGGLAEYCVADAAFCFPIPKTYSDIQAAPLLCAGLIGYRALRKTQQAQRLGVYGFGAAAHILVQVANYLGCEVYAFTRAGDTATQAYARSKGCVWAGDANVMPPAQLDAAIIFAPAGELVPQALSVIRKGGKVICGGIHMSDIPSFSYDLLWGERQIESVANLTRNDASEFLAIAAKIQIKTDVHVYSLEQANEALVHLRNGRFTGAYVIKL